MIEIIGLTIFGGADGTIFSIDPTDLIGIGVAVVGIVLLSAVSGSLVKSMKSVGTIFVAFCFFFCDFVALVLVFPGCLDFFLIGVVYVLAVHGINLSGNNVDG